MVRGAKIRIDILNAWEKSGNFPGGWPDAALGPDPFQLTPIAFVVSPGQCGVSESESFCCGAELSVGKLTLLDVLDSDDRDKWCQRSPERHFQRYLERASIAQNSGPVRADHLVWAGQQHGEVGGDRQRGRSSCNDAPTRGSGPRPGSCSPYSGKSTKLPLRGSSSVRRWTVAR